MKRETLAFALLFSVPPAIGLTGFLTVLWGRGPVNPLGAAAGGLLGAVLFLLVVKAAQPPAEDTETEPDVEPDPEG